MTTLEKLNKQIYRENGTLGSITIAGKIEPWFASEKQFLKLVEEVGEIGGNLAIGKSVKDDIGDVVVVLIGLAKLNGLSLKECLEHSYNEIKDRKWKMVNRVFIKEKDL